MKKRLDYWHTKSPCSGVRKLRRLLHEYDGLTVRRKLVRRYMDEIGICAIYPKPNLSKAGKGHKRPYLLKNLNMSTALNVFLRKAIDEEAIPFPVSAKSAVFGNGYALSDITNAFETAVHNEIDESQKKGFPVARYDAISKRAYLESADGTREYIDS